MQFYLPKSVFAWSIANIIFVKISAALLLNIFNIFQHSWYNFMLPSK